MISVRSISKTVRTTALAAALLAGLHGCADDGTGPGVPEARDVGVVLNSVDVSLSIFDAEDPVGGTVTTVGLAPAGSPVGMAVRGGRAAVPLGFVPAVALVDLGAGEVSATYALPEGSGATGVAFVDDTLLVVANPGRNTVSPVNLRTGTVGAEIPVGGYPQAVIVGEGRVVVVNSELGPDFAPTGPGTLTLLDARTLARAGEVALSGENPGDAAFGAGGLLYVVNSGRFGGAGGSLSVVDVAAGAERSHHEDFGDFPFVVELGPNGLLYVGSFSFGVAVWDPATATFVRPPADAVAPGGIPSTSGLAFDQAGRLHTLVPECQEPGRVLRLDAAFAVDAEVTVGTCPFGIAFTAVPLPE